MFGAAAVSAPTENNLTTIGFLHDIVPRLLVEGKCSKKCEMQLIWSAFILMMDAEKTC